MYFNYFKLHIDNKYKSPNTKIYFLQYQMPFKKKLRVSKVYSDSDNKFINYNTISTYFKL